MNDRLETVLLATRLLEGLEVKYVIGGSIASSAYGEPRSTNAVDIVIDLPLRKLRPLVELFQNDFYIDEIAARRAVDRQRAFNAINFNSLLKVDLYVAPRTEFVRVQFDRRRAIVISPDSDQTVYLASPEDVMLVKLRWYDEGGRSSERQLADVAGIVRIQGGDLDRGYLKDWAAKLGVTDLLDQVLTRSE